jgi:ABC-type multidrug transport system fused ATPase/permease subunit
LSEPAAAAAQPGIRTLIARLFDFMSRARRRQFAVLFALMIAGAVAEMVTIGSVLPFLSILAGDPTVGEGGWISRIMHGLTGSAEGSLLWPAALLVITAALVAAAIRLMLSWSSQSFSLGLGHDLSVEIQCRILHQPYSFHIRQHSSRILASLEKVQIVSSGVLLQVMQGGASLIIGTFIVIALLSVAPLVTAVAALALGGSYLLVTRIAGPRLARNSTTLGTAYDERLKLVQESLGSIRDIILDDSRQAYIDEFRLVDRRFTDARVSSSFLTSAPRFVIEAAGMVLMALLALYLSSGERGLAAALPILGALAVGGLRLLPLLQQFYQAWVNLAANRSIAAELMSLLALPIPVMAKRPAPLPFRRAIRFEQVSFSYSGREGVALEGIDLVIPSGARVAITGKTGSGKSSFADLMMGLLAPTGGRITIDGVELDDQSRGAWQQDIAHVPQSIFLADTSIARNVAIGTAAPDTAKVIEAINAAQLGEFVASLPDGTDTTVGERGVSLSGGQRQRLGLARAIYKDAPVLIFDEATNALDHETEAAILEALDRLHAQGRTIVIISHRPTSLCNCDLTIRLDKGKLVAVESLAGTQSGAA